MAVNQVIAIAVVLISIFAFIFIYGFAVMHDNTTRPECPTCDSGREARYEIVTGDNKRLYVCSVCAYELEQILKSRVDKT